MLFMPWIDNDLNEKFRQFEKFKDPDGPLHLADSQRKVFKGFARPDQFIRGKEPKMIRKLVPSNITQVHVSDCSFLSSLCIAVLHEISLRRRS